MVGMNSCVEYVSTVGIDIGRRRFAPYMERLQLDDVSGHVKLVVLIHKRLWQASVLLYNLFLPWKGNQAKSDGGRGVGVRAGGRRMVLEAGMSRK